MAFNKKNNKVASTIITLAVAGLIGMDGIYAQNGIDLELPKKVVDTFSDKAEDEGKSTFSDKEKNLEDEKPLNENISDDKNEIIYVADINLKKVINKELGKSDLSSQITKGELESLKNISSDNGSNKEIRNLEGIEYAINLENADLSNNNIKDISILNELFDRGNIKSFNLSNQRIVLEQKLINEDTYTIKNTVAGIDNSDIAPYYISDDGKYKYESVVWENLKKSVDYNLCYSFEQKNEANGKSFVFSGQVSERINVNNNPKIEASDKSLKKGEKFDPMKDVSAYDVEDKDLTDKIDILQNDVDTKKGGSYKVVYQVVDSLGKKDRKTITVDVEKEVRKTVFSDTDKNPSNNNYENNRYKENSSSSSENVDVNENSTSGSQNEGEDKKYEYKTDYDTTKDGISDDKSNNDNSQNNDNQKDNNQKDDKEKEKEEENIPTFVENGGIIVAAIFAVFMSTKLMNMK